MSNDPTDGRPTRHPRALRRGLIIREVGDETLVYDAARHRMHCLGPTMAAVWRACNGRRTPAEIAARAGGREPLDVAAVRAALARLGRARLVRSPRVGGATRRDALRGAGAAVAGLALVTLITPTIVEAASCVTAAECDEARSFNLVCKGNLPCCNRPGQACKPKGGAGSLCGCV